MWTEGEIQWILKRKQEKAKIEIKKGKAGRKRKGNNKRYEDISPNCLHLQF